MTKTQKNYVESYFDGKYSKTIDYSNTDSIDISAFPSGIYFLTIKLKDGKTETRKIYQKIVQNGGL
ncbi:hypothetical protein DRF59_11195 [Chryseobacterium flavum]|uniref:Secretion system C-terminal sorting domain-containing protein n=1 Tax=Chryseobacterium flavum TaxID=415851 RepID=A0A3D9CMH8_9FLAO|nr:hypothetical protein DRF59_11195 [Chryseobacterium flavum]